jgi:L-threonylcarbamoyladenylate synthase
MITSSEYDRLADAINHGFLVIYPTDTLYALGASVDHPIAIEQVFILKKRPRSIPLPVSVASLAMMEKIAVLTPLAQALIDSFLPGPLTIVLEKKMISSLITAGRSTIALRIPNDPIALTLLKKTGPLTVTSANIHHQPIPETIDKIRNMFISSSIVAYIDDGIRNGLPSTIVDARYDRPVILRKGSIPIEQIETVVSQRYG